LKNVDKVLFGNNEVQLLDNFSPAMITDLKNFLVTSVDVGRSFSTYINRPSYKYDTRVHGTKYSLQLFSKMFLVKNTL